MGLCDIICGKQKEETETFVIQAVVNEINGKKIVVSDNQGWSNPEYGGDNKYHRYLSVGLWDTNDDRQCRNLPLVKKADVVYTPEDKQWIKESVKKIEDILNKEQECINSLKSAAGIKKEGY